MGYILVCDDERSICQMLQIAFQNQGHRVETVTSGEQACRKIDSTLYDVVVTDVRMPQVTGMEVLQHSRRVSPDTMVIVITAVDDSDIPIEALNAGAFYYIRKGPKLLEDLLSAVALAMDRTQLRQQNAALKRDAAQRNSLDNLIGESEPMRRLKQTIRTIATTNSTVIVSGESGTGKELVARAIHTCSPRSSEPFVSVNCGAFPETLLESELFGYVKGSFTGATANKRGLFELASGGTIFLDEIGETTLTMQVKLLRVLQERCIRPVGGGQETPVDVRVIAATNKNLSPTRPGRPVPRRPLLPPQRHPRRGASAARPWRGRRPARQSLPQKVCRADEQERRPPLAREPEDHEGLRLARQCPRAGEHHRARRRHVHRRRAARRTAQRRQQRRHTPRRPIPEPSVSSCPPTASTWSATSPTSRRACCNRPCAAPTASRPAPPNCSNSATAASAT